MILITEAHLSAAHCLWDYHQLQQQPSAADLIFVLGSNDLRVAHRAVDLYELGLAPWIAFSGGTGRFTDQWTETEADQFAAIARTRGVPEQVILIENRSTNTGENIRFTRDLLTERGLSPRSVLAVQKPYMERRAFAAIEVQWPEIKVQITSPRIAFEDYCTPDLSMEFLIEAMVGDFQRILDYPALGFASVQEVTHEAMEAFGFLRDEGFNRQLR